MNADPRARTLRAYAVDIDDTGNVRHTPLDTPEAVADFLGIPRSRAEAIARIAVATTYLPPDDDEDDEDEDDGDAAGPFRRVTR